jgi:hypothetical protein
MCPPLGLPGARIGPALLMRRARGPSGWGEVRPTGGLTRPRRTDKVLGISRGGNIKESGPRGRAAWTTDSEMDWQTTFLGCVRDDGRAFTLLGCGLSPTRNLSTFVQPPYNPVGPFDFRVPVAANFRPCCRSTVTSLILSNTTAILDIIDNLCFKNSITCNQR